MKSKKANKVVHLTAQKQATTTNCGDELSDNISIEKMKEIWNDKMQYTDEQLYKLRDWIYVIAGIIRNVARIRMKRKDDQICEAEKLNSEYKKAG